MFGRFSFNCFVNKKKGQLTFYCESKDVKLFLMKELFLPEERSLSSEKNCLYATLQSSMSMLVLVEAWYSTAIFLHLLDNFAAYQEK